MKMQHRTAAIFVAGLGAEGCDGGAQLAVLGATALSILRGCSSGTPIGSEEYPRGCSGASSVSTLDIASSGECRPFDQGISENQYRSAKDGRLNSLVAAAAAAAYSFELHFPNSGG